MYLQNLEYLYMCEKWKYIWKICVYSNITWKDINLSKFYKKVIYLTCFSSFQFKKTYILQQTTPQFLIHQPFSHLYNLRSESATREGWNLLEKLPEKFFNSCDGFSARQSCKTFLTIFINYSNLWNSQIIIHLFACRIIWRCPSHVIS